MSFQSTLTASRVIETIENYSVSDNLQIRGDGQSPAESINIADDYIFWNDFIARPDSFWNKKLSIGSGTISHWTARIPGLFWLKGAEALRNIPASEIESRNGELVVFSPEGKSRMVLNGVATFLLPPDVEGRKIMTISTGSNASMGIPFLLSPEVIEYHHLKEGDRIAIRDAPWRQMSQEWSGKFSSVNQIKRGYIVVDHPDQIVKQYPAQFMEVYPCSVMEYQAGNALLYDYVFCTVDTYDPNHRNAVQMFFEKYRTDNGRYGKYLLAPDSTDAIFEAEFNSPADLLRNTPNGKSQMNLLVERIQNNFYHDGESIRSIMERIPQFYSTADEISALAIRLCIPQAMLNISSAANMSTDLVNLCLERKILEALVDELHLRNSA